MLTRPAKIRQNRDLTRPAGPSDLGVPFWGISSMFTVQATPRATTMHLYCWVTHLRVAVSDQPVCACTNIRRSVGVPNFLGLNKRRGSDWNVCLLCKPGRLKKGGGRIGWWGPVAGSRDGGGGSRGGMNLTVRVVCGGGGYGPMVEYIGLIGEGRRIVCGGGEVVPEIAPVYDTHLWYASMIHIGGQHCAGRL